MTGRIRGAVAAMALATSLSGCLTVVGMGVGGIVTHERNRDVRVQSGDRPRRSVGKSIVAGGGIGLLADITLIAIVGAAGGFAPSK